jgi:hypothetical protein
MDAAMRLGMVAVVSLLFVTGCGSGTRLVWSRAGATELDFRRDRYECDHDNQWSAGGSGLPGTLAILEAKHNAERGFRECMELRGWTARGREE